jgi:hypothetical protein
MGVMHWHAALCQLAYAISPKLLMEPASCPCIAMPSSSHQHGAAHILFYLLLHLPS